MSASSRPSWITAASTLVLVAVVLVHEHRDSRRFAELVGRIDELRVLQSMGRDARDVRTILPAGGDDVAERVANRVLAAMAQGGAGVHGSTAAQAAEKPAEAEPPRPRTPEQQNLISQGEQVVDRVLRDGQLRRSDVMELRDIFSRVGEGGGPEQHQLRDRVVKAINDQKLAIEDPLYILF
jgi:hypothetical protein